MEKHFIIVHTQPGMIAGIEKIEAIMEQIPGIAVPSCKRFNLEWACHRIRVSGSGREDHSGVRFRPGGKPGLHRRTDFPDDNNGDG